MCLKCVVPLITVTFAEKPLIIAALRTVNGRIRIKFPSFAEIGAKIVRGKSRTFLEFKEFPKIPKRAVVPKTLGY